MTEIDQAIQEIIDRKILRQVIFLLFIDIGFFTIYFIGSLLARVQVVFWLFAVTGVILGLLNWARRFHRWSTFSAWSEAKRLPIIQILVLVLIVLVADFGLSLIRSNSGDVVADAVGGVIGGWLAGSLLWVFWLYNQRAKSSVTD